MPKFRSFVAAVALLGLGGAALAIGLGPHAVITDRPWLVAMLVVATVASECRPVRLVRNGVEQEITSSATFSIALLLIAGLPAALVAQGLASLTADLLERKPPMRVAFNLGQWSLALLAFGGVLALFGSGPPFRPDDLLPVLAAMLAFHVVNVALVGTVAALHQGLAVRVHVLRDLRADAPLAGLVLCMAPVVAVVTDFSLAAFPLLLLPTVAVHLAGEAALRDRHRAEHDGLTDLPNRTAMHRRLAQALSEHARGTHTAVMFMDLDRFKEINDTLGHRHGDELLKAVARRLADVVLPGETVARLGGDEFALIVPGLRDHASAEAAAARILGALHEPIRLEGLRLEVDASLGIALAPEHGEDVDTLLQRADIAMYQAKDTDRRSTTYSHTEDEHSFDRLALLGELRRAMDTGQLTLARMPIVRLEDSAIQSIEALVRWEHPVRGTIPPAVFVPHAERTGLVRQLTLEVAEQALRQCARWKAQGTPVRVAVNLSTRNLLDRGLPEDIRHLLERHALPAELLELEITESTIMADPVRAQLVLQELHAMGVRLSIDDFGTGYSSLGYLKELPVSTLKIDRSFVTRMLKHQPDRVIVKSTIDLASNLGLHVVAEGIEDDETRARLASMGCHGGQGFVYGLPRPADEIDFGAPRLSRSR